MANMPNAFSYNLTQPPITLVKAYSGEDKDLPADREMAVTVISQRGATKSTEKVRVLPDDGTRGVEYTIADVARRFDAAIKAHKMEEREIF